eukprot:755152-Hanusia_phi.AAC.2
MPHSPALILKEREPFVPHLCIFFFSLLLLEYLSLFDLAGFVFRQFVLSWRFIVNLVLVLPQEWSCKCNLGRGLSSFLDTFCIQQVLLFSFRYGGYPPTSSLHCPCFLEPTPLFLSTLHSLLSLPANMLIFATRPLPLLLLARTSPWAVTTVISAAGPRQLCSSGVE